MDIVIIEDEPLTAEDLAETIVEVDGSSKIVASLESVKESIGYFNHHDHPDLIFCDIQLSDGSCFEIFKKVDITVPVIFCTAFDEYAIKAFKANGIDYIVKPFCHETVSEALQSYHILKDAFSENANPPTYKALMDILEKENKQIPVSFLVNYKDQILPIKAENIALFFIENEMTRLLTFDRDLYFIDKNLDEIDQLTGLNFFRANRQHLINREAVKSASKTLTRKLVIKLTIPYKHSISVSKAKAMQFLDWLGR